MYKGAWKKKIVENCKAVNTYREAFEPIINTLAETLEQRDKIMSDFKKSKEKAVIEYTNKAGATNLTRHPALVMWDDLNKSALAYWRDLGLTPAGLKKIDEGAMKKKRSGLEGMLKDLAR